MAYQEGESERPRTMITVYTEDREWLQARQREMSFRRNEHVTMFDLIHELIRSVWVKEEGSG